MSDREGDLSTLTDGEQYRYHTNNTRKGTRRTLLESLDWATKGGKVLGTQKEKSHDDTGFRRGRASAIPSMPGLEKQSRLLTEPEWFSQDLEGATTGHLERYQTNNTGERTRRTLHDRATMAAKSLGKQKEKSDESSAFRRERAWANQSVPVGETRDRLGVASELTSRDLELRTRSYSATGKINPVREI